MEDEKIVVLPVVTRLDTTAERVLSGALKVAQDGYLQAAIVIGRQTNGEMYFASSLADGGDVLWDLEKAKLALLHVGGAFPGDVT